MSASHPDEPTAEPSAGSAANGAGRAGKLDAQTASAPADGPVNGRSSPADAPAPVLELAQACMRFVEAAVGLALDYTPETLPVLDHYVATRREELVAKPEMIGLIARAAGAYFGEVVRKHFRSFWHSPTDDPSTWELRFEPVFLSFSPLAVAYDAITHGDEEGPTAQFQLDDEDRDAVEARLSDLPSASDEEFYSFSTRLEVLEIAVDAIKARMMSSGLADVVFTSEDYE